MVLVHIVKATLESQCDNANPHYDSGGYLGYFSKVRELSRGSSGISSSTIWKLTPFVIPENCELEDEQLLFLSDVLPTAYWSVENAGVKKGIRLLFLGVGQ